MSDTLPNRAELDLREFTRYEAFVAQEMLASRRVNLAPAMGEFATDLAILGSTPLALGLVDVSRPDAREFSPKPEELTNSFETYERSLGKEAITTIAPVAEFANRRTTAHDAILAQAA